MATKSTKEEVEQRVLVITEQIAQKKKRKQIIDHCINTLEWKLKPRAIDLYIQKAKAGIAEYSRRHRLDFLATAMLDCVYLYKECLKDGNHATALAARKELSKLQGLYEFIPPSDEMPVDADSEADKLLESEGLSG